MQNGDRRNFLKVGGAVLATGVVGSLSTAQADEHKGHMEHGGQLKSDKGADALR